MDKLLVYGLDEDQIAKVRETKLKFELAEAGCYQDALAHYADLTIINPDGLEQGEMEILANSYRENDPVGENVIVTGDSPAFERIPHVRVEPDFFDEDFNRSVAIMREIKEVRDRLDFSREIALAIRIMKLIEEHPGITTKRIAEIVEMSPATVRRYIRSLQTAFVLIEGTTTSRGASRALWKQAHRHAPLRQTAIRHGGAG